MLLAFVPNVDRATGRARAGIHAHVAGPAQPVDEADALDIDLKFCFKEYAH